MKFPRNFIHLSGINQRGWLNPLFLAVIPAILIIWLQPIEFSPLLFNLTRSDDNVIIFFADIEGNGTSERLQYGDEVAEGHAHIKYHNDQRQYIGQYNFNYPAAKSRTFIKPYVLDINKDGAKDIIVFTQNKDSVFIEAFDYTNEVGLVEKRFVTKIGGINKHLDYHLHQLGHYDSNKDSVPEFYFSIAAGFAKYPRRAFRYDFVNDSLIASLNTGAGYLNGAILQNNDSIIIALGSSANGNIRPDYPYSYHDSTTWFFCFDKDLKLKFPPKNYGSSPSGIEIPIQKNGFIYYLFASNNASPENKLYKMSWQGELIDSIVFDFFVTKRFTPVIKNNKTSFYIHKEEEKKYLYLDIDNFVVQESGDLTIENSNQVIYNDDLNQDGKTELIAFDQLSKQLVVHDHNFNKQNEIANDQFVRLVTANYYEDLGFGEMAICSNNQTKMYQFRNNPNQYYKYLVWLGIYFVAISFMSFVLFLQNLSTQKQQKMEKQLADLQLQNLRNQLDPHFTFNVLNSVGNAIYKQDKEAAYDLFQRFTRIIRSSLMSSDKVFRSLKEELQFTQDYLEFQKVRFKDRFNYSIEIEKGIETQFIQFPKMLIQGFAENAVKHAFYEVDYTGLINVKVFKENDKLKVIIEDNGIGINKSKDLKTTSGTQKGLGILQEQVKQINKLYHTSYSVLVEDKMEQGFNKKGTQVEILL